MRVTPEPMDAETVADSFLGWTPDPSYNPEDFKQFQAWVEESLRPTLEWLMQPVSDNWIAARERARRICALRYWLAGVVTTAENYLAGAKYRATYLKEVNVGDQAKSDKIRWRMDDLVKDEKTLVQLLSRYIDAMDREVSFLQSLLRQFETEARMAGLEQ